MKRELRLAAGTIALCCVCSSALADIPGPDGRKRPPGPPDPNEVKKVEVDPLAPSKPSAKPDEKSLKDGVAGLRVVLDKNAKMARLVIPAKLEPEKAATGKSGMLDTNSRTIIAGLALSLAAVSLVLLPRWKRSTRVTAAAVVSCLALAIWVSTANGNAGPPRGVSVIMGATDHKIFVQQSEDGDVVVLVLPEAYLKELSKELK